MTRSPSLFKDIYCEVLKNEFIHKEIMVNKITPYEKILLGEKKMVHNP